MLIVISMIIINGFNIIIHYNKEDIPEMVKSINVWNPLGVNAVVNIMSWPMIEMIFFLADVDHVEEG